MLTSDSDPIEIFAETNNLSCPHCYFPEANMQWDDDGIFYLQCSFCGWAGVVNPGPEYRKAIQDGKF